MFIVYHVNISWPTILQSKGLVLYTDGSKVVVCGEGGGGDQIVGVHVSVADRNVISACSKKV
jgi:hypothetical protein